MTSGGHLLVRCLEAQGVDRVFCVPGESYLDVLDGLVESTIQTIVARQEGGAAMMAEADAKLTGRPGIAMVTRGPGACNAASGIHVAQQDSTPLIVFVGQIARRMTGRDAFQEVDYRGLFGTMTKGVIEINQADRIPELVQRVFSLCLSGRPGPVVVVLPEDMLRETSDARPVPPVEVPDPAPDPESMRRLRSLLAEAERPFLILGGSRWNPDSVDRVKRFAEDWDLPVGCSFRRQMLFDHLHTHYAGDVGIGINPGLGAAIRRSDLLILLGGRMSEIASCGYTLLNIPMPDERLVHIHPEPAELGRVYFPALSINATPKTFLESAGSPKEPVVRNGNVDEIHRRYLEWSRPLDDVPGDINPSRIVEWLRDHLRPDTIITNGAGNYSVWIHRFYRFRQYGTQLAPTSGSMGYGLPAAIAAKLRHPEKTVVCFAGDGCFQMTSSELACAMQYQAAVIVVLFNNCMHGTIRMHQEMHYPGRVSGTSLDNPDFGALGAAYGAHIETIHRTVEFGPAFERAEASGKLSLIELVLDPDLISPTRTLSDLSAGRVE